MAKANENTSLIRELLSARLYKQNQGRVVRQVTAVAIAVIAAAGAWQLKATLLGGEDVSAGLQYGIPGAVFVAGAWAAYRLVNWPPFANFLISVEAEMDKVTWADWDYLKRATGIVLVTMLLLGVYLFGWDILWQKIFTFVGFLDLGPSA